MPVHKNLLSFLFAASALCAPLPAMSQEEDLLGTAAAPAVQAASAAVVPPLPVAADVQQGSSAPVAAVAPSTVTINVSFAPTQDRDPMRSPQDVADAEYERNKVKIEEEKRRKAARDAAQAANPVPLDPREQAKQVIKGIKLQGIVGDQVIINGNMHSNGDVINGAKIVRITPETVTFTYRKFTFTKKMQEF